MANSVAASSRSGREIGTDRPIRPNRRQAGKPDLRSRPTRPCATHAIGARVYRTVVSFSKSSRPGRIRTFVFGLSAECSGPLSDGPNTLGCNPRRRGSRTPPLTGAMESGRPDSNRRSQAPRACGLTRLSHALDGPAQWPRGEPFRPAGRISNRSGRSRPSLFPAPSAVTVASCP